MIKLKDLIFEKRGPCWKGYSQIGMKKKGNKMVPNCVKKEEKLKEKVKPKQKISKKEWSKIKKFNKHIGQDGTHYVTQLDKRLGTILVPVVVEEKLTEKKQGYVVADIYGGVYTKKAVSEKKALAMLNKMAHFGGDKIFMIGVEAWNKPHKANKKKIMVGEAKFIPTVTIEFTRENRGKGRTEVKKFKTIDDAKKYTRKMNKKYKLKRQKRFWGNPVTGIELTWNFS